MRYKRILALAMSAGLSLAALSIGSQPAYSADPPTYGSNLALASAGGVATASGREVPTALGPELAIDGIASDTSRWSGEPDDDSWFQVELAEPSTIDHVTISWSTSCPIQYTIQVSMNGTDWSDASDVVTPEECRTRVTTDLAGLEGQAYQYIRMQGMERRVTGGQKYGYSIEEMEVWNGPVPPPEPVLPITPAPATTVWDHDAEPFMLAGNARVVAAGDDAIAIATPLADQLRRSTGYALPVVGDNAAAGDIEIVVNPAATVPGFENDEEAYSLTVSSTGITVAAPTAAGAFYGVQSLRQLFPAFAESPSVMDVAWTVPSVRIVDAPRFEFRGFMLDLARSFISVDQIKEFIDSMSYVKLNVLHLHLSDDQGWRIEITNEGRDPLDDIDYTRLTSVSGGTAIGTGGPLNIPGQSGFLTQDDYREIVAYAAEHHVMIIPEIDGPAHSGSMLHAIPQLNTSRSVPQPPAGQSTIPADDSQRVGHTSLDTQADVTYTFLRHVFTQLAEMTPGPYLHLGGDEGHSTSHADYLEFMDRAVGIVHEVGKRTMGWNEYAVSDLQPSDLVQYYNHSPAGTADAAVNKGAEVVVSYHPNTYLDYTYPANDLNTYYGWDVAATVPGVPEGAIKGVEAPLWTAIVRSDDEAEYQAYPRLIGTAEVGWSPKSALNLSEFERRMAMLGGQLTLQGTNFYPSALVPWQVEAGAVNQQVQAGIAQSLSVGTVLAPGTSQADLTVTIDWGDGTEPSSADVTLEQNPDIVHVNGAYEVDGSHEYTEAGEYAARIIATGPNGSSEAPFTVQVTELGVTIDGDAPWYVRKGHAFDLQVTGAQPGAEVRAELDSGPRPLAIELGAATADADGAATITATVPRKAKAGDYELVVIVTDAAGIERELRTPLAVTSGPKPPKD